MTELTKRSARFSLVYATNADQVRDVFEEVVHTLERTDEMYPVQWNSIRVEQIDNSAFKVSVMTEPALKEAGIMDVEPTIQLAKPSATGGTVATPRDAAASPASPGTPPRTSFPDTSAYIL